MAASGQLDDTRKKAREVTDDLRGRFEDLEPLVRERWNDIEPVLRDRWNDVEPVLRERWNDLEPVVRERWEDLEPVLRDRLEDLEPAARQAQIGLWRGLQALGTGLAVLPTTLLKVLRAVAGSADDVAERGAKVGEEARKRRRRGRGVRLRRRTLVLYVAGGAGTGFAIGWLLGRRGASPAPDPYGYDEATMDGGRPLDVTDLPGAEDVTPRG